MKISKCKKKKKTERTQKVVENSPNVGQTVLKITA